jgi:hypothetical protein
MKLSPFILLLLLLFSQCNSIHESNDTNDTNKEIKAVTFDITGHWQLLKTEIIEEKQTVERFDKIFQSYVGTEAIPPVYKNRDGRLQPNSKIVYFSNVMPHLNVTNDTILGMNYPLGVTSTKCLFY